MSNKNRHNSDETRTARVNKGDDLRQKASYDGLVTLADAEAAVEAVRVVADQEMGRFQDEIRNRLIERYKLDASSIDGAGSDADEIEFTWAEIEQAIGQIEERSRAAVETARRLINQAQWLLVNAESHFREDVSQPVRQDFKDAATKLLAFTNGENKLNQILAKCPHCAGVGWYITPDQRTGEQAQEQCQWCAEVSVIFSSHPTPDGQYAVLIAEARQQGRMDDIPNDDPWPYIETTDRLLLRLADALEASEQRIQDQNPCSVNNPYNTLINDLKRELDTYRKAFLALHRIAQSAEIVKKSLFALGDWTAISEALALETEKDKT